MMYNVWNKLFLRKVIIDHDIYFPKGKSFNEDRDFVRNYLQYTQKVVITDECFYHYLRENGETATGKWNPYMLDIRKEEYHVLVKYFKEMGIYNEEAKEYAAREHFERVVGTTEQLVRNNSLCKSDILKEISKILKDRDTRMCMNIMVPKSRKMKIIRKVYSYKNPWLVYKMIGIICKVRIKYPEMFYRLKQAR